MTRRNPKFHRLLLPFSTLIIFILAIFVVHRISYAFSQMVCDFHYYNNPTSGTSCFVDAEVVASDPNSYVTDAHIQIGQQGQEQIVRDVFYDPYIFEDSCSDWPSGLFEK